MFNPPPLHSSDALFVGDGDGCFVTWHHFFCFEKSFFCAWGDVQAYHIMRNPIKSKLAELRRIGV